MQDHCPKDNHPPDLDPRLLLLDAADNVVVVRQRLEAGSSVRIAGLAVSPGRDIPLGHKLARRPIRADEKIIKYAAPIGRANCDIAAGEHVHVHNMRSDYTPTYTLDAARQLHGGDEP